MKLLLELLNSYKEFTTWSLSPADFETMGSCTAYKDKHVYRVL